MKVGTIPKIQKVQSRLGKLELAIYDYTEITIANTEQLDKKDNDKTLFLFETYIISTW